MKSLFIIFTLLIQCVVLNAQKSYYKSDDYFIDWAKEAKLTRGYQNIKSPLSGKASYGNESDALGKPDNEVVSLGDGGEIVLSFETPLANGEGADFAIFENGVLYGEFPFLELAFVEVSSNGIDFFRFPAVSKIPNTTQKGGFDGTDPGLISNLAGKALKNYGTPFDLEELKDIENLNIKNITHIKIIDVVGCIDPEYATRDSQGNIINDPFPTPFASSGFDLDAIGVINNRKSIDTPPFVKNPLQDIVINENSNDITIDINNLFADNEYDEISITVSSSNSELVTASINSNKLLLSFTDNKSGESTINLTATANGKSAEFAFNIKVLKFDKAPIVVKSIENIVVEENSSAQALDLSEYFSDEDGDKFEFIVVSNSNEEIVNTQINGASLTISFVQDKFGEAAVTIRATANGKSVETSFKVTVNKATSVNMKLSENIKTYPNPFIDFIAVESSETLILSVKLYAQNGSEVYSAKVNSDNYKIHTSNLVNGIYILKIVTIYGVLRRKVVKG